MAVKYICDRCKSEEGVGRVSVSMAVSTPHDAKGLPKIDADLCGPCKANLCSAVLSAIVKLKAPAQLAPEQREI